MEVVVAASVFAFVTSAILGVYVATLRIDSRSRAQRAVIQNSRFIMEYLTKKVRGGSINYAAYPGGSTANSDSQLWLITQTDESEHIYLSGTDLKLDKNAQVTNLNSANVQVSKFQVLISPGRNPLTTIRPPTYNEQPRVTVILELTSNYGSGQIHNAKINLQTTIATREYPSRLPATTPQPVPPPLPPPPSNPFATGGAVTTSGGFRIHTFTSSGTLNVTTGGTMEYLVVGGGGGGGPGDNGNSGGGGGGAGGSVTGSFNVSTGNVAITVGAGGASSSNGGESGFGGYASASGGGAGAQAQGGSNNPGAAGGSGGGGSRGGTGGAGISGQGNRGGNSIEREGGGGGGAGSAGSNASSICIGANGGSGISSSISGSSVTYAGGGGGGGCSLGNAGSGGSGGGGNGGSYVGQSGIANSGGGGGGGTGGSGSGVNGGTGGSGIVIIRYQTSDVTLGASITGSFTFAALGAGGNAALIDDTNTPAADPAGLNSGTYFRLDFGGTPRQIRQLTVTKDPTHGVTNPATMKLEYSDNDSSYTQVGSNFMISSGTDTTPQVFNFPTSAPHRYWRVSYVSGTTGGNIWIREIEMME